MITWVSKRISSSFISHGIIPSEDREVYEYSFEVLFSTVFCLLTMIIIAALSKTLLYTAFFMAGFIPIRLVAGGFHAKNHFRCFLVLIAVYAVFLFTLLMLPSELMTIIVAISVLLSPLLVFLFAPSEDKNNPISKDNYVRLGKKSRIAILVYTAVIVALTATVPDIRVTYSIAMGVFSVGMSLLANYIKHRNCEYKNNAASGEEVVANEEI